jgi:hypothetical protein
MANSENDQRRAEIAARQENRWRFLQYLYDDARRLPDGQVQGVHATVIAEALGLSPAERSQIEDYLTDAGLIDLRGFGPVVGINSHGIAHVEETLSQPQGQATPGTPPTTYNIHIEGSTVGVVNTGSVGSLEVNLATLQRRGDEQLASALRELSESIINSTELGSDRMSSAREMLETVATEAARPAEQRNGASMRAILKELAEVVKVSASLSTLWERLGPVIWSAFL